jgi:hypothetical protein
MKAENAGIPGKTGYVPKKGDIVLFPDEEIGEVCIITERTSIVSDSEPELVGLSLERIKERDEKLILALIKLDRDEYEYDLEEMQEYYRKVFAEASKAEVSAEAEVDKP